MPTVAMTVDQAVARAPKLTPEQIRTLRRLLPPVRPAEKRKPQRAAS